MYFCSVYVCANPQTQPVFLWTFEIATHSDHFLAMTHFFVSVFCQLILPTRQSRVWWI